MHYSLFDCSSLLPGAGPSKPKLVKGVSKQANKLLGKSWAPDQVTNCLLLPILMELEWQRVKNTGCSEHQEL